MNLRRGISRFLFILLVGAAFVVILVQMLGFSLRGIGYFIVFWLTLLLAGLVIGYCVLFFGRLIGFFSRKDLNEDETEGEQKSKKPKSGFNELIWVTSVITGAIAFFLVPLTSTRKEAMPDQPINFILSFSVFLVTFCLVWAVYNIILFVIGGFADNGEISEEE